MGKTWRLHAAAALGGGVACAVTAATAAADTELSATSGVAAARNVTGKSGGGSYHYHHVWPPMQFGWRVVLGSLVGFFGAAFGSAGGVGGGGILVPMLTLIIGFDPKSSTAMSKCMVMGVSVSTVYYNLKLKHPTLDMPLIDYDLALLIQPMLMLGISIGVVFNVIFPDWLITVLLTVIFLDEEHEDEASTPVEPADAANNAKNPPAEKTSILKNVYWKEFGLLAFVWMAFLTIQIVKNYTSSCSTLYWVLNSFQMPVSLGLSLYEAHGLMSGKRKLASTGPSQQNTLTSRQLFVYCLFGILAGLVGGQLGLGGGFIMGPLFLELGIPPQVSSATSTFAMMFSSSMSVVEYYLLNRFPVSYAAYFTAVAVIAAIIGQHCVRRLIDWLGRSSLIIFIMASMIFTSAITLGGVGISNIVHKMKRHQYMGFESLCN